MTNTTNFDDNNFLQDWLENRYGCGVMQEIMDDITGEAQEAQSSKPDNSLDGADSELTVYDLPYCMVNYMAANDNPYLLDLRKIS